MPDERFPRPDSRERPALLLLAAVLLVHLCVALLGWGSTGLPHNGFREAQTAISALFIQKTGDFSLAYPTPVLGPPWSVPMEFPLYQWTVVGLGELTGLDLPMAGRVVGLACFYLSLPAFSLLLGRLGLVRWQRHLLLAAVVSCPLYLFYARAFLIETMALMFGAWFLYGYVRTGEERRPAWLALALTAGLLGALVKITTLLFFLMPAAAWTLRWIWGDLRAGAGGWPAVLRRGLWCAPAGVLPVAAALAWVAYADGVKAASVSGAFLQSSNLRDFNYGFGRRFTADTWRQHVDIWFGDLVSWPLLIIVVALAAFFGRRWWREISLLLAFFLIVQTIFPLLYAFHPYYYVANAWSLMMAGGLVAVGLLQSTIVPRSLAWLVIAGIAVAQIGTCLARQWPAMTEEEPGSQQLIEALRQATNEDDVLIVAGDDWSSVIPYNAQRRSLMLRTGVESDRPYLERAFATLRPYKVGALVVCGDQRFNAGLIGLARDLVKIDTQQAFSWKHIDVYLAQGSRNAFVDDLLRRLEWPEIAVKEWQTGRLGREVTFAEVPSRYEWLFAGINPLPASYFTGVPLARYEQDERSFFDAQPPKRLTFRLPAGEHTFNCEIGILPGAYEETIPHGDRTDGILVLLSIETPGAEPQTIFTQEINPRDRFDQRGLLKLKHAFALETDATMVLTITPGPRNNAARDWVIMGPLSFR